MIILKALFYAVSFGGDTNTIASMAGAIAGAFYGAFTNSFKETNKIF